MQSTFQTYKPPPQPPIPCALASALPGVCVRRWWQTAPIPGITPGADGENLNLVFGALDADGLPTCNVAYAPTTINLAGAQTGNPAGYFVGISDCWLVLPVGVQRVWFRPRAFGNTSYGLYVGPDTRDMRRWWWNNQPVTNADFSDYTTVCGRELLSVRLYTASGYFNGGYMLQWSMDGVAYVDVPTANVYGAKPTGAP